MSIIKKLASGYPLCISNLSEKKYLVAGSHTFYPGIRFLQFISTLILELAFMLLSRTESMSGHLADSGVGI